MNIIIMIIMIILMTIIIILIMIIVIMITINIKLPELISLLLLLLFCHHNYPYILIIIIILCQVYIDQNHAIKDEHASRHLLRALTDFLVKDCWDMSRDHDGGAGDDSRSNGATSVFSRLLMISGVILTGACSLGFCLAC